MPYLADLKSIFRIDDVLAEVSKKMIQNVVANLTKSPSALIGIHIRSNEEFKTHLKAFKARPTKAKYYQKAIEIFIKRYHNPLFLIVSDSPKQDAERTMKLGNNLKLELKQV